MLTISECDGTQSAMTGMEQLQEEMSEILDKCPAAEAPENTAPHVDPPTTKLDQALDEAANDLFSFNVRGHLGQRVDAGQGQR